MRLVPVLIAISVLLEWMSPTRAESAADVLKEKGLLGNWANDCVMQSGRVVFTLMDADAPRMSVDDPRDEPEKLVYDITSATRVTEDKLKIIADVDQKVVGEVTYAHLLPYLRHKEEVWVKDGKKLIKAAGFDPPFRLMYREGVFYWWDDHSNEWVKVNGAEPPEMRFVFERCLN